MTGREYLFTLSDKKLAEMITKCGYWCGSCIIGTKRCNQIIKCNKDKLNDNSLCQEIVEVWLKMDRRKSKL